MSEAFMIRLMEHDLCRVVFQLQVMTGENVSNSFKTTNHFVEEKDVCEVSCNLKSFL